MTEQYFKECSELREELVKKYPKLFKQRFGYPAVMKGWLPLVDKCCEIIQNYIDKNNLPQVEFMQIKEKFGSMRLSLDHSDEFISSITFEYEGLSYFVCEYCGSKEDVGRTEGGWIYTICDKCFDNDKHFNKYVWKQNKNQYKDYILSIKDKKDNK